MTTINYNQSTVFGISVIVHAHFSLQSVCWGEEELKEAWTSRKEGKSGSGSEEKGGGEAEEELASSSKMDEIVVEKGYTTSIIWKWFGYGRLQSAKYVVGWCQLGRDAQQTISITWKGGIPATTHSRAEHFCCCGQRYWGCTKTSINSVVFCCHNAVREVIEQEQRYNRHVAIFSSQTRPPWAPWERRVWEIY